MFEDLAGQVAVVTGGARGLGCRWRGRWRVTASVSGSSTCSTTSTPARRRSRRLGVESVGDRRRDLADVVDAAFAAAEGPRHPTAARQRRRHHDLGGQPRRHRGVVAPGDRHQPHRHVPLPPGVRPRRAARQPRRRDRQRLLDVGRVVNVPQHQAAYNASKAAVDQLTRVARRRVGRARGPRQRRRARLLPVRHDPAVHRDQPGAGRALARDDPGRTDGRADDLDGLVVFLGSDASSYVVGQSSSSTAATRRSERGVRSGPTSSDRGVLPGTRGSALDLASSPRATLGAPGEGTMLVKPAARRSRP